jgi:SNF2 family DNA or RNA helicase
MVNNTIQPNIAGQEVRIKGNPANKGVTTGKTKEIGNRLLVQIQFGTKEKVYKPYNLLEPCGEPEDISELLQQGVFSNPDALRRILTFHKLKGNLTNIFYSMESSNTDFYPHQFKPVLKFLESPVGRLLIADEVGLGKTIEATYIWKELQARADARRLLIVCPALLREKWRSDLLNKFNIEANIVNADDLLEKAKASLKANYQNSFICIASLEGLRPPNNWSDERNKSAKAELSRLLDRNLTVDEAKIFDLVIIDEAHYLRNQTTANNRLGKLLRDSARHLILLTATPIQINSFNLYELLRIINPDQFFDRAVFEDMLNANAPLTKALQLLLQSPPDLNQVVKALDVTLKSQYFANNIVLQQIRQQLAKTSELDDETRISLSNQLENSSLVSQYLTRSRKREVLPNRVERTPQTLKVNFSLLERQIYDRVTEQIRQQTKGKKGINLFRLISRQRQMASSLVAAIQAWKQQGIVNDLVEDNEIFWEDFGVAPQLLEEGEKTIDPGVINFSNTIGNIDREQLEREDSKYQKLIEFLSQELQQSPQEKLVLFAYFRETLFYLQRRLQADGISTCLIVGDMGDRKWEIIKEFQQGNASILLSSEVGSEGIDLQFCRFLINYDLPWNPMRVEQRIGRLDRLGQKAERISIINFSLVDTIEETILERLYDRIQIFQESIGDLENILGETTEKLLIDLFDSNLTEPERDRRSQETILALTKQRVEQEKLEEEAINLLAFSEHILTKITHGRDRGRWLSPDELHAFVEDFFALYYPGTIIEPVAKKKQVFKISLSEDAKVDLQIFIQEHKCSVPTLLTNLPVNCFFDAKVTEVMGKRNELLDPTHPLIQWIRTYYEQNQHNFHQVSAIELDQKYVNLKPGIYVYAAQLWSLSGLKTVSKIVYKVAHSEDKEMLADEDSEALITQIAAQGKPKPNAINLIKNRQEILIAYHQCDRYLEQAFDRAANEFEIDNHNRCDIQQQSAQDYANRRKQELEERIAKFKQEGQLQMIPATEGLLNKINRELEIKKRAIATKRDTNIELVQLAAGVIFIQ